MYNVLQQHNNDNKLHLVKTIKGEMTDCVGYYPPSRHLESIILVYASLLPLRVNGLLAQQLNKFTDR